MKESYEMSWKPPRRTLRNVPKVKLTHGYPLPESASDVTPVNEELLITGQTHTWKPRNDTNPFSGFLSSLPVASETVENNYFAEFDKTSEHDQGDDADLDQSFFSDFGGTGGSTLDNSTASFVSWADEIELQDASRTRAFQELEVVLYEEGSSSLKDDEMLKECFAWKNNHIFLRVRGKNMTCTQELPDTLRELEEETKTIVGDCEIIASHGSIEEFPEAKSSSGGEDAKSSPNSAHGVNLTEKMKEAVLEQLTFCALSEVLKSREQDQQAGHVNVRQSVPYPVDSPASALAGLSEDLGRALQISGRSIHRSPKMLGVEFGKKTFLPSSPEHIQFNVQPKRFLSSINAIPEDKISLDSSFSVLGVPKPLNTECFNPKMKVLEKRGFHSAADRKRPGILDRRFSCISPEHETLLKPIVENVERARKSSGGLKEVMKSKQISAPNTPFKLLRHLTLPPIQNLNSFNKLPVNSEEEAQSSLTHIRSIFVKNKVSLTPLPNAINTPEVGQTELQVAKQMLESTSDSGRWSTCRKLGFSGIQNLQSRKKSIEKHSNNL